VTDVDTNGRPEARTAADPPALGPPPARGRARDLGIAIGLMPTGPTNSIVDVAGVKVGHATVWRDEERPPVGRGTARSGVTVVLPDAIETLTARPIHAGVSVLNGSGEMTARTQIDEQGVIESPIFLTSTMAVGRVYDAAIRLLVAESPAPDPDYALVPVVTECSDGFLSDARFVQVDEADVRAAIVAAAGAEAGAVQGGVVGAGTGMVCHELKGGIGSASRRVVPIRTSRDSLTPTAEAAAGPGAFTVGVLALTNYGWLEQLIIDGVRVGPILQAEGYAASSGSGPLRPDSGSVIIVIGTDAPLDARQLTRLARRAGLGIARTGAIAGDGSGDMFLAFSTSGRAASAAGPVIERSGLSDAFIDPFFAAAAEATEEAVVDSLVGADTVVGRDGNIARGMPLGRVVELLRAAGRPASLPQAFGVPAHLPPGMG
jgi:D-aminopeptidase